MPQVVHTDLKKLLWQLLKGTVPRPVTVYLGLRTNAPQASDTLASVTEIGTATPAGYARLAITTASLADSGGGGTWTVTLPLQTFAAFTATPAPNGATHWFLCSAASGTTGSLYASGPLNPAVVTGTLASATAAGQAVVSLPTSLVSQLAVKDWLSFGTVCGADQELAQIASLGTDTGGNTPVTMAANLSFAHPSGEAFSRDGATRTYVPGYQEKVQASLSLV